MSEEQYKDLVVRYKHKMLTREELVKILNS